METHAHTQGNPSDLASRGVPVTTSWNGMAPRPRPMARQPDNPNLRRVTGRSWDHQGCVVHCASTGDAE